MPEKIILSVEDVRRSLSRVAHEIVEHNRGGQRLVFVGMHTRGVPLARRLASLIADFEGTQVPVGALDISFYRDDLSGRESPPLVRRTDIPTDISGKHVILVDDVLYTGRSIRAALDALIDLGRPESIQLAVLVDRGHREIPIRADYVGKNLPSARYEEVQVRLQESDGRDEVVIVTGPEEGQK